MSEKVAYTPLMDLIREEGTHRVSIDAAKQLSVYLEELAREISKNAVSFSVAQDRVTVKPRDMELAVKKHRGHEPYSRRKPSLREFIRDNLSMTRDQFIEKWSNYLT